MIVARSLIMAIVAMAVCAPVQGQRVVLLETDFDDPSSLADWSYLGTGGGFIEWVADVGNPGGALVLQAPAGGLEVQHWAVSRCYEVRPGEIEYAQQADAFGEEATCAFSMMQHREQDCSDTIGFASAGNLWGSSVWSPVGASAPDPGRTVRGVRFGVLAAVDAAPGRCRIDNFRGTGPPQPSDIPTLGTLGLILLVVGVGALGWRFAHSG